MQDKNEQAATVAASEELGKFGTVAELYAAYNELEREFTKRCQLIKQLQAQLSDSSAQAQAEQKSEQDAPTVDARQIDAPVGEPVDAPAETATDTVGEERIAATVTFDRDAVIREIAANAEMYAESLAELSAVMDACLSRYKQKLISFDISAPPSGLAVIVPKKRPRSLADAKRLADEMLAE